jgi:hypothetical protein
MDANRRRNMSVSCTGERGSWRKKNGGERWPVLTAINDGCRRDPQASAARFDGLGATRMWKKGEVREGVEGFYRRPMPWGGG